ncbi:MAG: transcription termination/antitermination protein NusG [Planctomycetota bacterium]
MSEERNESNDKPIDPADLAGAPGAHDAIAGGAPLTSEAADRGSEPAGDPAAAGPDEPNVHQSEQPAEPMPAEAPLVETASGDEIPSTAAGSEPTDETTPVEGDAVEETSPPEGASEAPQLVETGESSSVESSADEAHEIDAVDGEGAVGQESAEEHRAEEEIAEQETVEEAVVEQKKKPSRAAAPKKRKSKAAVEEPVDEGPKSEKMDWYILKVQSNREESIREGLMRRVRIAGLNFYFGDAIVPTEKVTDVKGGKRRVLKRKLYPGYLVVQMELNDDTWFLVRETPGIGDFTGAAGRPSPMLEHEVSRILAKQEEKSEKAPKLKINFKPGDQVKINEGTFENFEGEVASIDQTNGRVTVMINIFGRSTPVELEYWQVGAV